MAWPGGGATTDTGGRSRFPCLGQGLGGSLNWLDFAMLVVAAWFIFAGLTTGLIREVLGLAGLIVGLVAAKQYYAQIASYLPVTGNEGKIAAFVLIFLAVAGAAHLLSAALHRVVDTLFLGWLDHLGGAVFGFIKGVVVCQVALLVCTGFPALGLGPGVEASVLAPSVLKLLPQVLGLLPPGMDPSQWLSGIR